jgi:hypothetical protein
MTNKNSKAKQMRPGLHDPVIYSLLLFYVHTLFYRAAEFIEIDKRDKAFQWS